MITGRFLLGRDSNGDPMPVVELLFAELSPDMPYPNSTQLLEYSLACHRCNPRSAT